MPYMNGPRVGRGTGRQRKTLVNNASHSPDSTILGAGGPPGGRRGGGGGGAAGQGPRNNFPGGYQAPLSLGSSSAYGNQLGAAQYGYLSQLAQLRQQVQFAQAQRGQTFATLRTQRVADTASAANVAADRGIFNSSVDLSGRAGAAASEAQGRVEAQTALAQAKLGAQAGAVDARAQYFQTAAGIQAQMQAERARNTIAAFQADQFDAVQQSYQDILNQLRQQKSGRMPRTRVGLMGVTAPIPTYQDPYNGSGGGWAYQAPNGKPLY